MSGRYHSRVASQGSGLTDSLPSSQPTSETSTSHAANVRFSDFDEIVEGTSDFGYDFVPIDTGEVVADFERVELGPVVVQRGEGKLPHYAMRVSFPKPTMIFLAGPSGDVVWDGRRVDRNLLFSFGPDGELVGSTRGGGITFASLIWEPGILEQRAEALGLSIDTSGRDGPSSTPDPAAMHELRAAIGQTLEVARSDPARLGRPEVRESLFDTIVTAAVHALHPAPERRSVAAVSHVRAVRAAFDVLEARAGDPIYLAELCLAARVSERTLRSAFQNLYGVSPIRYLALRRMELVRRALRDADPRETRVSAIASRYGFTNLGRFAMEFRQLYGESPSQTLRRA